MRNLTELFIKLRAVLAGGTALALRIGHRKSLDLDFFTTDPVRPETVISWLRISSRSYRILSEGEDYIVADVDGIKVSIFHYEYPLLQETASLDGVPIAGILDIAAMKLIAISQRGTKRDFIDLFFILQDTPFYKIARHSVRRFGRERINAVHIGKSLVYFSDADSNPDPDFLEGCAVEWDEVRRFFRRQVKQMVLDLDMAVKEER